MTKLRAVTATKISQEFLDEILNAFRQHKIKDTDSIRTIYRRAGQQDVIEFIKSRLSRKVVSGDPDEITRKKDA